MALTFFWIVLGLTIQSIRVPSRSGGGERRPCVAQAGHSVRLSSCNEKRIATPRWATQTLGVYVSNVLFGFDFENWNVALGEFLKLKTI